MIKGNYFTTWAMLALVIFLTAFTPSGNPVLADKKITKAVIKTMKTSDFVLKPADNLNRLLCSVSGSFYYILSGSDTLGTLYKGRVNSCRAGGCSLSSGDEAIAFEYFDYFFITDSKNNVRRVKVFNYQATYGQEIMSRGWLNQFNGLSPGKKLEFGRDIEAISGATVSAKAITDDIQKVLTCLNQ
ncbi:MAG: FMN-binding protein [Chlorobi bacterium]|nr:FMN-binding protein [Chlorobiota bacterium]